MPSFSISIERLIEDICIHSPSLKHIKPKHIIVSCVTSDRKGKYGTLAELYPMKYDNAHYSMRDVKQKNIYIYRTPKLEIKRREILYILFLKMPRFGNLSYREKLETLFHELYHIHPKGDGRLRIIHPRYTFHGPSLKKYDHVISKLVDDYLKRKNIYPKFLGLSYGQLKAAAFEFRYIAEPTEKVTIVQRL